MHTYIVATKQIHFVFKAFFPGFEVNRFQNTKIKRRLYATDSSKTLVSSYFHNVIVDLFGSLRKRLRRAWPILTDWVTVGNWGNPLRFADKLTTRISAWVAGNEVIVKNVNTNILFFFFFLYSSKTYLCLYRGFFCLSRPSFAFLPQLNSLIQFCNGLIQFLCKSEAALVCGFVVQRRANEGTLAFAEKLN